MKHDSPGSFLEREMMNRYPNYGTVPGRISDSRWTGRRPFRTTGLPVWQLNIISRHPDLYISKEDVGVENYCHLALGFQVEERWARVIIEISRTGTAILEFLHSSGLQHDARISVVRVEEATGVLRIAASDNLRVPFREIWRSHLHALGKL